MLISDSWESARKSELVADIVFFRQNYYFVYFHPKLKNRPNIRNLSLKYD